ncbi:RidA family protein [Nakamurella sp. YIM 132087]|uniref:RidA family protein n=1 Tax=Nakamurella alba TaxID=2665158 RepID=A0A7K1FRG3_9ACTN|nr:Rid family hydrolase [Nakamurella alba]MTD16737.1 RidA family protein [Nakamurella alba]
MSGPVGERRGSGGPWEAAYGYSRVVRVGPLAVTAGCTATVDGVVRHPGDAGAQTKLALQIALDALAGVGIEPWQVVSTRMYVTDISRSDEVGTAHGEVFAGIRPAATMVEVSGLIDPAMLVEVELQAWAG